VRRIGSTRLDEGAALGRPSRPSSSRSSCIGCRSSRRAGGRNQGALDEARMRLVGVRGCTVRPPPTSSVSPHADPPQHPPRLLLSSPAPPTSCTPSSSADRLRLLDQPLDAALDSSDSHSQPRPLARTPTSPRVDHRHAPPDPLLRPRRDERRLCAHAARQAVACVLFLVARPPASAVAGALLEGRDEHHVPSSNEALCRRARPDFSQMELD